MAWLDDVYRREAERHRAALLANQPQAPQVPAGLESDRAYLHTPFSGVFVPALQSVGSGLVYGITALVVSWIVGLPDPGRWFLASFAICQAVYWTLALRRWMALTAPMYLLDWLERVTGHDINGDGRIADDLPPPQIVRIEVKRENGQSSQTSILDLPGLNEDKVKRLAAGLVNGAPFSQREWSDMFPSRDEFNRTRELLIEQKLLAWKSEKDRRQGVGLTDDGVRVFSLLAGLPVPLPQQALPVVIDA